MLLMVVGGDGGGGIMWRESKVSGARRPRRQYTSGYSTHGTRARLSRSWREHANSDESARAHTHTLTHARTMARANSGLVNNKRYACALAYACVSPACVIDVSGGRGRCWGMAEVMDVYARRRGDCRPPEEGDERGPYVFRTRCVSTCVSTAVGLICARETTARGGTRASFARPKTLVIRRPRRCSRQTRGATGIVLYAQPKYYINPPLLSHTKSNHEIMNYSNDRNVSLSAIKKINNNNNSITNIIELNKQ